MHLLLKKQQQTNVAVEKPNSFQTKRQNDGSLILSPPAVKTQ
jgi:hypothetical protein